MRYEMPSDDKNSNFNMITCRITDQNPTDATPTKCMVCTLAVLILFTCFLTHFYFFIQPMLHHEYAVKTNVIFPILRLYYGNKIYFPPLCTLVLINVCLFF